MTGIFQWWHATAFNYTAPASKAQAPAARVGVARRRACSLDRPRAQRCARELERVNGLGVGEGRDRGGDRGRGPERPRVPVVTRALSAIIKSGNEVSFAAVWRDARGGGGCCSDLEGRLCTPGARPAS